MAGFRYDLKFWRIFNSYQHKVTQLIYDPHHFPYHQFAGNHFETANQVTVVPTPIVAVLYGAKDTVRVGSPIIPKLKGHCRISPCK